MDALALLCNLHADGPATLQRLREAGCRTLDELERLEPTQLADVLESGPARVRRFFAESRALRARLVELPLDDEAGDEPVDEALDEPGEDVQCEESAAPAAVPARAERPVAPRPMLDAVLAAWRTRDEAGGGDEPAQEASERADAALDADLDAALDVDSVRAGAPAGAGPARREPEVLLPRPPAGVAAREPRTDAPDELRADALDGLGAAALDALRRAGVRTLGALAASDPLRLARASGLAFGQCSRLVFLARRARGASAGTGAGTGRAGRDPLPGPPAGGPFA